MIVGRARPGSPLRPAPCDLVILPDPSLILPPKLYPGAGRQTGSDLAPECVPYITIGADGDRRVVISSRARVRTLLTAGAGEFMIEDY